MTDTDPYTGIRTRENIVADDDEVIDDNVWNRFIDLQQMIAARNPVMPTRYTTLRQRLAAVQDAETMREIDAAAVAEEPRTLVERAFELGLVPAEDLPAHEQITKLRALVADMEHDWRTLNGFFNATAVHRDWCEEYEQRLAGYNQSFKVLRMVGREDSWIGSTSCWRTTDGSD